jgi:hypothetical protein
VPTEKVNVVESVIETERLSVKVGGSGEMVSDMERGDEMLSVLDPETLTVCGS